MRRPPRLASVFACVASVLFLFALAGCESKVTKANFDKIQEGMSLEEVEKILGQGTQRGDGSGVAAQFGVHVPAAQGGSNAETFTWESDTKKITVYFVGGKVKNKDFR